MSQKLPLGNFELIKDTAQLHEDFTKNYNEKSDEGDFLEDEKLRELHNDIPFLPERIKIEIEKIVANLHDKTEYVIYIRNLKQALNYGLVF